VGKDFQNLQNRLQTIGFYESSDHAEIDFEVCLICAVSNCFWFTSMYLYHSYIMVYDPNLTLQLCLGTVANFNHVALALCDEI